MQTAGRRRCVRVTSQVLERDVSKRRSESGVRDVVREPLAHGPSVALWRQRFERVESGQPRKYMIRFDRHAIRRDQRGDTERASLLEAGAFARYDDVLNRKPAPRVRFDRDAAFFDGFPANGLVCALPTCTPATEQVDA